MKRKEKKNCLEFLAVLRIVNIIKTIVYHASNSYSNCDIYSFFFLLLGVT